LTGIGYSPEASANVLFQTAAIDLGATVNYNSADDQYEVQLPTKRIVFTRKVQNRQERKCDTILTLWPRPCLGTILQHR
jgi:hypothetical protein